LPNQPPPECANIPELKNTGPTAIAATWTHLYFQQNRDVDPPRHDRVVGPPDMAGSWTHPDTAGRGSTLDIAGCGSTPRHDRAWVHSRQRRVAAPSAMAGWSHSRLAEVWSHIAAIAAGPVFFSSGKFALLWRWLVWQVCPSNSDSSRPTTSRPGGPSGGRPLRVTVRTPSPKTGRPQRRLASAGPTRRSGKGWSHPTVLAGWSHPTASEGGFARRSVNGGCTHG
jgi:hypothetical protein